MPMQIAMLLLALGCAPFEVTQRNGETVVAWVCPPIERPLPNKEPFPQQPN
jgi:hypothetical protein